MATSEIHSLPTFDTRAENVSMRWKKWKRAFNLYITAKNYTNDDRKVATLLYMSGFEVQELYYSIVGDEQKNYKQCVEVLDNHFIPKSNVIFERYEFRQMNQDANETVDQFVCRLRKKAETCNFDDVDNVIRDQLIDKCKNSTLKRKFLEQPETANLSAFMDVARAFEAIESQMQSLSLAGNSDVNAVRRRSHTHGSRGQGQQKSKGQGQRSRGQGQRSGGQQHNNAAAQRCFRCNRTGHYAKDPDCPARGAKCSLCHRIGHFRACCNDNVGGNKGQTRGGKSKNHGYQSASNVQNVGENDTRVRYENESVEKDFAFSVNRESSRNDFGYTDLEVGDAALNKVLIDSGASCNLVDESTWEELKRQQIRCTSKTESKTLFAYGQSEPMETLGTFRCVVMCKDTGKRCVGEFTVIKGEGRPIIGKATAERLDMLRVGPPNGDQVCSVVKEGCKEDIVKAYPEVFNGVGRLKNCNLKLHIDRSVQPIAQNMRRIPYALRDKVDAKLEELKRLDIIEEVPKNMPTTWVSPLVCIPKGDGDVRICVDMRCANEAIKRERHPIPTVDDVLHTLNGATVFSKLDVKMAFHQIELDEESRDVTTFICHKGLMRYKRLNFGITSAPEHYQKIVKDLLRNCEGVANIADDIIVYGSDLESHDTHMNGVLSCLKENGLTLNENKCRFRMKRLTFFGHDLSADGVSPSEEKVSAIRNAKAPVSASEVRSFLGLVQYSARFISNFAEMSEPLRKLTRQNQVFKWEAEEQMAFENLKDSISQSGTLAYFRYGCQTRIIADAGPSAIGAVLVQFQDGCWKVVSYASRTLTDVERRYCQTEKEALALVWACERFSLYVFGSSFELETDHKPLEHIYSKKSRPSARIERWVLRLQGYDYKVVYKPGRCNIADALSRLGIEKSIDKSGDKYDFARMVVTDTMPNALSPNEVEQISANDAELDQVRQCIQTGRWNDCNLPSGVKIAYIGIKNELCIVGKLVLRNTRIVIPTELRQQVLDLAHEGHPGIVKMKSLLRTKVWWPKMDKDVERICRTCHACQVVGSYSTLEPMSRVEPPTGPWQDLACDLLGPMPSGEHILVLVDYYSRYVEVAILRSITSESVIKSLEPMFARFGFPHSLKTDNARYFTSEIFQTFLSRNGVTHLTSPPLWPQANGEVERQNRTLLKTMKIANVEGKNWRVELTRYLLTYRSTPHSVTGATPAYLMFRREIRTKLPELRPSRLMMDEGISERDWQAKLAGKFYADARRGAKPINLKVGDQVLLKNEVSGKLEPNFQTKPAVIKSKNATEVIVETNGKDVRRNSSFVKPYKTSDHEIENNSGMTEENVNESKRMSKRERNTPSRYGVPVTDIKSWR